MDEWKPVKFASGLGASSSHAPTSWKRSGTTICSTDEKDEKSAVTAALFDDIFQGTRQRLSSALENCWSSVYINSWMRHFDSEIVVDLRSVRSYQVINAAMHWINTNHSSFNGQVSYCVLLFDKQVMRFPTSFRLTEVKSEDFGLNDKRLKPY